MLEFPYLFVFIASFLVIDVNCSSSIADDITKYYESEARKSFKREWQKYKISYEHVIAEAMKENVGVLAMNNYARHAIDSRFLIAGNLFADDHATVELKGMKLRVMPRLIMPVVTLAPASSMVRLESTLTKMFIDTEYAWLPSNTYNHTSLAWDHLQIDSLTIIAEDCFLSGFSITTFGETSLNLGHSQYHISGCKIGVEITQNQALPPVTKPYLNETYVHRIEKLLTRALLGELASRLQGALYTFVNTTECDRLPQIRSEQQKLFKQTAEYMSNLCVKLNNMTLIANQGHEEMEALDWTEDAHSAIGFKSKNVILYGLDTAYVAGDGGSFEASKPSIAEAIKFRKMQIRSKRGFRESMEFDYSAELTDVTVNVILNVNTDGSYSSNKLDFVGWRTVEYSHHPQSELSEFQFQENLWLESLVQYYLMVNLEKNVVTYLRDKLNQK